MPAAHSSSLPPEKPSLVYEYIDPLEGFKGWFVRDRMCHRLCAGGMRVQKGLTCERLIHMARNMTRKMQIANLRVDGAKSGIDYDPESPGKAGAVTRFIQAIRPYVESSYSMGPDLNLEMEELENVARKIGIPSVKMAIARAQNWDLAYYLERSAILNQRTDGWTVSKLRAGYGLASAVLAVLDFLAIKDSQASVVIQGFGTLAKAAAHRLHRAGVRITGVADIEKCITAPHGQGLNVMKLLQSTGSLLEISGLENIEIRPSDDVTSLSCDVLVPAAVENSIPVDVAASLKAKGVVPGANLAVPDESLAILEGRSIIVLPDYLAGCGGSLSMEGLFAPEDHPSAQSVLDHVDKKMFAIVSKVLQRSASEKISPTAAALRLCHEADCRPDTRPYGKP